MAITSRAHDEMRELAAAYVLSSLTPDERGVLEAHLQGCAECAADVQSLGTVAGALLQTVPQIEPPVALRHRVLSELRGALRADEAPKPARSTSWLSGLAAAASLAAVALGAYALQLQGRVDALEGRLREALVRAQASESQIAETRRVSSEARSQIAVLMAPDVMRVDLAGQKDAPAAAARAFWSRSRGLVLAASSLPPLPPGRIYQLWFVAGTQPTSAGIFEPDSTGGANVLLTVDPNVVRPDVLAVTIEPAGGVPAPTGAMYLVGSVQTI